MIRFLINSYHIAAWEFTARVKSRSFFVLTLILPLMVLILFTLPLKLKEGAKQSTIKMIGLINLNQSRLVEQIQNQVNQHYISDRGAPIYIFMPISLHDSGIFQKMQQEYQNISVRKDSVDRLYDQIVALRTDYYTNPRIRDKEYLLEKTYQQLIAVRDIKTQLEKDSATLGAKVSWVQLQESKKIADSLLWLNKIDAYVVIPQDFNLTATVQYHSWHTDDLAEAQQIQKIVTEVVAKLKMADAGMDLSQVEQWLMPVGMEKILDKRGLLRKDAFIQFFVLITAMAFLLIAIFSSGGFLLSSIYREKSERTIEILLSKTGSVQIITGKVLGLALVGMVQIMVWSGLAALMTRFNFFLLFSLVYPDYNYFFFFQLIFILGYLFYGALILMAGTYITRENDIQRINTMGPLLLFICILSLFMIPDEFKTLTFKVLLYFPFFTPFMTVVNVLRTGWNNPADMYILGGGYFLLILILFFLAGYRFKKILYRADREAAAGN